MWPNWLQCRTGNISKWVSVPLWLIGRFAKISSRGTPRSHIYDSSRTCRYVAQWSANCGAPYSEHHTLIKLIHVWTGHKVSDFIDMWHWCYLNGRTSNYCSVRYILPNQDQSNKTVCHAVMSWKAEKLGPNQSSSNYQRDQWFKITSSSDRSDQTNTAIAT